MAGSGTAHLRGSPVRRESVLAALLLVTAVCWHGTLRLSSSRVPAGASGCWLESCIERGGASALYTFQIQSEPMK